MTEKQILEKLQPHFRQILNKADINLKINDSPKTLLGWDSVAHLDLLAAAETETGVKFDLNTAISIVDIRSLVQAIQDGSA